jgi:hypothetical protein
MPPPKKNRRAQMSRNCTHAQNMPVAHATWQKANICVGPYSCNPCVDTGMRTITLARNRTRRRRVGKRRGGWTRRWNRSRTRAIGPGRAHHGIRRIHRTVQACRGIEHTHTHTIDRADRVNKINGARINCMQHEIPHNVFHSHTWAYRRGRVGPDWCRRGKTPHRDT